MTKEFNLDDYFNYLDNSIKNILLDFYHNPESRNKLEMEMVPEERFPSLDELLEKIQINGIKALSLEEKKLLDDYSHGK